MKDFRQQFRRAVSLLQSGRSDAALPLVAELREAQPDHPEVLHLAGVVHLETGDVEGGEALLRRAAERSPGNPEIAYNHGSALLKLGRDEAALALFDRCVALNPQHASAWQNRGTALTHLGRGADASASYRRVLELQPGHVGALFNLANLALDGGRHDEAAKWYQRTVDARSDHGEAWLGLATARRLAGHGRAAVEACRRATALRPGDAAAWQELGRACSEANDFDDALAAHRKATELAPDDPDAWNSLGAACAAISRLEEAEAAFRRALEIEPEHPRASANYATLLELANRPEEAMALVDRADGNDPRLALVAAKCARRRGQTDQARRGFLALLEADPPVALDIRKDAHFSLGQLLDRAGEAEAAFRQFTAGNEAAHALWRSRQPDAFLPGLAGIRDVFAQAGAWARRDGPAGEDSPAFLFGFQRSGTTLLDTVLGTHPRVRVMEEQPVLNRVIATMNERMGPYPAHLPKLGDADLEALRERYFEVAGELADYAPGTGVLLLDKSPLHTVHAGFLHMLFPNAPRIFALRHPLDVCLSCFMQDFTLTPFMTNFLTVTGAARVYREVMDLWLTVRDRLDLAYHELRYEALVADPEAVLRETVEYLGLDWRDQLLAHERHARDRGLINTPSYEQVTQPIYRSAVGRWERYREQLGEAEAMLAQFVDAFGYDPPGGGSSEK